MPRDLPWRKWMPFLILAACALVWLSVLIPGVMRARDDARRTTSKRNLEILWAAFHSYHDAHQVFPPGSIIASDGTAMHGWETMLLPHFDSSRIFSYIDFDYAWNDPVNEHLFRAQKSYFLNPVVIPQHTTEGYFLSHYSANPAIFHRNQLDLDWGPLRYQYWNRTWHLDGCGSLRGLATVGRPVCLA